MRHFIVLGFGSNSKKEQGKSIYLGADRSKALETVNAKPGKYLRREMYELAVPHIRRNHPVEAAGE